MNLDNKVNFQKPLNNIMSKLLPKFQAILLRYFVKHL